MSYWRSSELADPYRSKTRYQMSRPGPASPPTAAVAAVVRPYRATSAGTIVTRANTTRTAMTRLSARVTDARRPLPRRSASDPGREDEDGPADLLERREHAARRQDPGDVAVQQQHRGHRGDDERGATAVAEDGRPDHQQEQRGPHDADQRAEQVGQLQLAEVLRRTGTGPGRRREQRMHRQRPAAPRRAKPPGDRGRGGSGRREVRRAIVGHQRIIGPLTITGATSQHA